MILVKALASSLTLFQFLTLTTHPVPDEIAPAPPHSTYFVHENFSKESETPRGATTPDNPGNSPDPDSMWNKLLNDDHQIKTPNKLWHYIDEGQSPIVSIPEGCFRSRLGNWTYRIFYGGLVCTPIALGTSPTWFFRCLRVGYKTEKYIPFTTVCK